MSSLLSNIAQTLIALGSVVLALFATIGKLTRFAGVAIGRIVRPPWYPAQLFEQMLIIGYFSLPVVGLTALFTGSALAQQIYIGGSRFSAASTVPAVTVIGIVRELGPVLGGLMVAGRVASASPATGLAKRHESEQGALLSHALGLSVRSEIRRRKKA